MVYWNLIYAWKIISLILLASAFLCLQNTILSKEISYTQLYWKYCEQLTCLDRLLFSVSNLLLTFYLYLRMNSKIKLIISDKFFIEEVSDTL